MLKRVSFLLLGAFFLRAMPSLQTHSVIKEVSYTNFPSFP
jgi:hypothetical protein